MINIIWFILIIIGIIYSLLTGSISLINDEILLSGKSSLNLIINILEVTVIWNGILNIALKSNLLDKLSNLLNPILSKLFPEIKKDDDALKYISCNVSANMLGLGSAATPFGLKAMKRLQELNDNKTCASSSMITFLVLNTSGVTIIPTTVLALRSAYNSFSPSEIIIPSILATLVSSSVGLFIDYLIRRRNNE